MLHPDVNEKTVFLPFLFGWAELSWAELCGCVKTLLYVFLFISLSLIFSPDNSQSGVFSSRFLSLHTCAVSECKAIFNLTLFFFFWQQKQFKKKKKDFGVGVQKVLQTGGKSLNLWHWELNERKTLLYETFSPPFSQCSYDFLIFPEHHVALLFISLVTEWFAFILSRSSFSKGKDKPRGI